MGYWERAVIAVLVATMWGTRAGDEERKPYTLVYAIPTEAVRRTRRGSLWLPVEAMAARVAWLVGELSQHDG
jgi:hypothetical protein